MVESRKKVLVALSGGLDSAAVVFMLKESLYDVEALYLDITGAAQQLDKAQKVAQMVGVKLHVEHAADYFGRTIVDYVLSEHQAGRTPSPCGMCNPLIKWEMVCATATRLGFEKIATGHYVRLGQIDGKPAIRRGADPLKDQSYYLWGLGSEFLSRAVLPLGGMTKLDVRKYLQERGFNVLSSSSESMSLCFLEVDGQRVGYDQYLRHHLGPQLHKGEVVDMAGRMVGTHDGYQLYTPGQKRGFCTTMPPKEGGAYSVVEVCAQTNRLTVSASENHLYSTQIRCSGLICNHIDTLLSADNISVVVRGLGRNPEGYAKKIEATEPGTLLITLSGKGAWALAPGQPVVFYMGDVVLGGAIVENHMSSF